MTNPRQQKKDIQRSVAIGERRKELIDFEISKLEGNEKIKYDISVLERHIASTKYDISHYGEKEVYTKKLKIQEESLAKLKAQLIKLAQEQKKIVCEKCGTTTFYIGEYKGCGTCNKPRMIEPNQMNEILKPGRSLV